MNQLFKTVLEEYLDGEKMDNKDKEYHKVICKKIPEHIKHVVDNERYKIKGSCGASQKTDIPWIGIFDTRITTSAQKGIYIVYLFRADMKGFYLCIGQGVTNFEKYKKDKDRYMRKAAEYFKEQIDENSNFCDEMKLYSKVSRGQDYETASVITKYYDKSKLQEYDLEKDLKELIEIYHNICEGIEDYDKTIESIITDSDKSIISIKKAKKMLENIVGRKKTSDFEKTILTEIAIPKAKERKKERTKVKSISKLDYVEKAKKDEQTGLKGEDEVMQYEEQKMRKHHREDLIGEIQWVSQHNDKAGYDIESFDFDETGKKYKIYIEVKTTKGNEDTNFFITRNEINKMKELGERYWIYRVCKVNGKPQFFKIQGTEFNEKITLEEYEYIAKIK